MTSIMEYVRNSSFNCRFNMRVAVIWEACDFVRSVHSVGLLLSRSNTGRLVGDNAIVEVKCP